jgi:hypothetical protein
MGEHAYGIDEIIGVKWRIYGIFDDTDALMALVYRSLMIMDKEEARLLYERTMVYLADEVLGTPQEVEQSRAVWLIPDQNGYTYGLSLWYTDDGVYMMVAD